VKTLMWNRNNREKLNQFDRGKTQAGWILSGDSATKRGVPPSRDRDRADGNLKDVTLTEFALKGQTLKTSGMKPRFIGSVTLSLSHSSPCEPGRKLALKDGDRVVFYGDSITDQRL